MESERRVKENVLKRESEKGEYEEEEERESNSLSPDKDIFVSGMKHTVISLQQKLAKKKKNENERKRN